MKFEDKVKLLRALPQFKVIPISEVRAIAYVAKESGEQGSVILGNGSHSLFLSLEDSRKIVREYPDLAVKLTIDK